MTVYVVQKQHQANKSGELVPKFDLTPAAEFGPLEYLLSPTAAPWSPESVIDELHEKLCNFNDTDHLLLVGNPVLIGLAVSVAGYYNDGRVTCLQWSGREKRYLEIKTDIMGVYE